MTLLPKGKTVATGSKDGTVKLWNIDTGKVIKEWMGHTKRVRCMYGSLADGRGRVLSGSSDETFRVWDVESGETIIGPINTGSEVWAVCYSPDAKMIATGGNNLKIWNGNTGELLKTLDPEGRCTCLAWTSNGKTLIAGGFNLRKFDTATWTEIAAPLGENIADTILLSPNERIFANVSLVDQTVQLWNLETNQPIGIPLHHEYYVKSATFFTDGNLFLITSCPNGHIYTWDVSAIVKDADPLSDIADPILQPAPKMKSARQIPPGFFDNAQREADFHTPSQSHNHPVPRQSFWRRSKSHRATEPGIKFRSQPLTWTRNLVSGILHRQDGSDGQLREAEVPYTAGKPRNYHARKKKLVTSSSRPPNNNTTHQSNAATQSIPSSSQQPPPTAAAPAAAGTAGTTGTTSRPHISGGGWHARFVGWLCCIPVQNTNSQP